VELFLEPRESLPDFFDYISNIYKIVLLNIGVINGIDLYKQHKIVD